MFNKKPKWMKPRDHVEVIQLTAHVNSGKKTYDKFVLGKRLEIEAVFREDFNWDFMMGEEFRAAQLLYNEYEDVLPVNKELAGSKRLRETINEVDTIMSELGKSEINDIENISKLPVPLRYELLGYYEMAERNKFHCSLVAQKKHHEKLLSEHTSRTNQRAYNVALALRVIFEYYSKYPITVMPLKGKKLNFEYPEYKVTASRNYGHPSGDFMKSLEKIYKIVEIDATLHHYAKLAKETPDADKKLKDYRYLMHRNLTVQTQDPFILTEFGWTKNSTNKFEIHELYRDVYSYREIKKCYRKYMRTKESMTTRIQN